MALVWYPKPVPKNDCTQRKNPCTQHSTIVGMASSADRTPLAQLHVREQGGRYFYEAKFWFQGRQVKRSGGPGWLEADDSGGYKPRRGRPGQGFYEERTAITK